MDMSTSTSIGMSATSTAAAAAATSSMPMTMDMGGDGAAACKISMLWNWYTVDACFISSSWHVTSSDMFAGSCIGVIFLVMALEFLRRASREYDRYILQAAGQQHLQYSPPAALQQSRSQDSTINKSSDAHEINLDDAAAASTNTIRFRPNFLQQVIRAALHMLQFAVAYFIMLLAMYYNGYIIICIILGAFLGAFVFSWEGMSLESNGKKEATFCCG